jgi:4-oxalocrotonate tautomerase
VSHADRAQTIGGLKSLEGETMPLVRIELRKGRDATYREEIGRIVHEALVSVGVPKDDRFQVISEHEPPNFVFDPTYLGIRRSEDLVIIQITWNEGRTVEQKKALYKAIADGLAGKLSLRREDVFVGLVEVKKENWSFGNGIAQYA